MADTLFIRFSHVEGDDDYPLELASSAVGEQSGKMATPYDPETWQAIMLALEPGFDSETASTKTIDALEPLGDLDRLHQTVGASLAQALLADEAIREGFEKALGLARGERQTLPIQLRFGSDCDDLAALPWELLYHDRRFLVADTSIALSRYPTTPVAPLDPLIELPLRVLLVLSEPLDATPTLSREARRELLHGLRSLDEKGAVIVDLLRPPTYQTLVEAVTNGRYHMLVFYGHGIHDPETGGRLLFEDEFGGQSQIPAETLGTALNNTGIRLALLGACQSASVTSDSLASPNIWQGTAQTLLRAGVPLAVGMQVSMTVGAALAFFRQFALSLAAGKPIVEAVADGRKPLKEPRFNDAWFIPALYGRPRGDTRLFDPDAPLPDNTAELRTRMKERRAEIEQLEQAVDSVEVLHRPEEIVRLRRARSQFAQDRAELARRTPGGYAAVTSPLYGMPSNPVFVGRQAEMMDVSRELRGRQPVVVWGTGGIGKTALAVEVANRQSWRFPAGVLWLDCRGGPALDTLLDVMGAFCGLEVDQIPPEEKESTVRLALARLDGRSLLVWDNAELSTGCRVTHWP